MSFEDIEIIRNLCKDELDIQILNSSNIKRLGGLTNKNYKVIAEDAEYVIRIPGEGTSELINRKDEFICTKLTNDIGLDSQLLYFNRDNGIKIAKYISDAETMNTISVKSKENMEAIVETFQRLHNCGKTIPVEFNVFNKIKEYEVLLKKSNNLNYFWNDYESIKGKVYNLKDEIDLMNIQLTMCHNDPLCENFIKGSDRMYLIDWEYAGMNDPLWDIADFFIEAEFTTEEEDAFNCLYFGHAPSEQDEKRIIMNKVFLDFLWSLWGKQRYSCGDDLLEYANTRYDRAKRNLELII